jgi:hypothetical protein
MTAPIHSISVYNSSLSLVERVPNIQQTRQPDFVQVRQNKIASIDREINAREQYVSLLKQRQVKMKESQEINLQLQAKTDTLIQLHKESRALGEKKVVLIEKQINVLEDTNKKLLALFDRNDSPPAGKVDATKTDAPIVTSSAKSIKNENIATRPDKLELSPTEKAIEKYQVVSNKPIDPLIAPREVGKVFDYAPHESVKPKDTVTLYQPNSPQIRLLAAQSKVADHVEDVIPSQDAVKLDRVMQQLMYYSQKNIWESIVKNSLVTKLV